MACPSCGSWSVKADRSLAGRYVCGRCGKPLGLQAERQVRRRHNGGGQRRSPRGWWIAIGLLSLGGLLASLELGPRPQRQQQTAPLPLQRGQPDAPPGRTL